MHRAATLSHVEQESQPQPDPHVVPLQLQPFSTSSTPVLRTCGKRATPTTPISSRELHSTFDSPIKDGSVKERRPLSRLTQWNSVAPDLSGFFHASEANWVTPFRSRNRLPRTPLAPLALTTFEEHVNSAAVKYNR